VVVVESCCIPRLPISLAVKQVASNGAEEDIITCFATDIAKVKRRRFVHIPKCFPYSPSDLTWFALLDTYSSCSKHTYTRDDIRLALHTHTHMTIIASPCADFHSNSVLYLLTSLFSAANSSTFLNSFVIRDASHKANKQSIYCYCGHNKQRSATNERESKGNLQQKVVDESVCPMLVCNRCHQHFHFECVKCIDEPLLVGDDSYNFRCGICNLRFLYI
jgi:hypothetical protein